MQRGHVGEKTLRTSCARGICGMELPADDRARGVLEKHQISVLHQLLRHPCLHAFVLEVEPRHSRRLLVMILEEALQPLLQFGRRLDDLSRVVRTILSCKPQHVFAPDFGLLVRSEEHRVIFGPVVIVDEGCGEVGLPADARVLCFHHAITPLSLRFAEGALEMLHGWPVRLFLGHALPLVWQGCALCVAACHRAVCSPRPWVLGRQSREEVVGFLGELAVAALLDDPRVPRVLDALMDGELHEEVQGVLPIGPREVQRLFRSLRLLVDRRDGEGGRGRYGRDLVEVPESEEVVTAEEPH